MSRPTPNLTGERFGLLVVVRPAEPLVSARPGRNAQKRSRWACLCDCGNEHVVLAQNLKAGVVKSCGCLIVIRGWTDEQRQSSLAKRALDRAKARWKRDHAG